jgi:hypothetical protein
VKALQQAMIMEEGRAVKNLMGDPKYRAHQAEVEA